MFEKSTAAAFLGLRNLPPSTVTNDGQKPLTQEKSLLQDDWSIVRLRPNSVSTGAIDTQFDCTPQSPQPSQTSSLMTTRFAGSGNLPRFLRRRFSAAHVWSYSSTVQPGMSRISRCTASISSR